MISVTRDGKQGLVKMLDELIEKAVADQILGEACPASPFIDSPLPQRIYREDSWR